MIESSPAAGVLAACHYAEVLGLDRLMSFDMGGTTAKACLIENRTPLVTGLFEVDRRYRFKEGEQSSRDRAFNRSDRDRRGWWFDRAGRRSPKPPSKVQTRTSARSGTRKASLRYRRSRTSGDGHRRRSPAPG